jgi:hypothetical protein
MARAVVQVSPNLRARPSFLERYRRRLAVWSLGSARLLRPWRWWWLLLLLAVVMVVYVFFGSAGRMFKSWPIYMTEYDMLSDSFRQGHTYLPIVPDPKLVAAPNPYDPVNSHLWVLDESYYKGKYYLYWGPVPPLLQALVKAALGIDWTIGDQYIVFVAWCVASIAITVLLWRLSRRLFGEVPRVLLVASIVAYAFANPVLHLISTAGVYQAAISAGQAFLWVGVALASEVLFRTQTGRTYWRYCLMTGVAFALAMGSRLSLLLAMLPITALTALFVAFAARAGTKLTHRLFAFMNVGFWVGLPMALCMGGLMLYNKARFDDYFESGIKLQLSSFPFAFSFKYFPANLHAYFLEKFRLSSEFPWVIQQSLLRGSGLPDWINVPAGYVDIEPHTGVLRAVPIVWLAPIAIAVLLGFIRPAAWRKRGPHAALYAHACLSFALAGSVTAIPVWGLYVPSMRYLGDFTSGLVLLGVLGGLSLYVWAKQRVVLRKFVSATICTLSGLTLLFGLLLGYQGYTGHFEKKNPKLHETLTKALSFRPR